MSTDKPQVKLQSTTDKEGKQIKVPLHPSEMRMLVGCIPVPELAKAFEHQHDATVFLVADMANALINIAMRPTNMVGMVRCIVCRHESLSQHRQHGPDCPLLSCLIRADMMLTDPLPPASGLVQ